LKKEANSHAARYNLRSGLLVSLLAFSSKKIYRTKAIKRLLILLSGKCVSHEIDVLIKKDNELAMVECKFHSARENKSNVKVPLYVFSRFNDLKERKQIVFSKNEIISKCWIVTNNRFTSDAIVSRNVLG
jgi:hypothetical protein